MNNQLVLEGREIKVRLQAEQAKNGSYVHVDWLRVSFKLRHCPAPAVDVLFPSHIVDVLDPYFGSQQQAQRQAIEHPHLETLEDKHRDAAGAAWEVAQDMARMLGPDFSVLPELFRGKDFFKYCYKLARKGYPIGWVGFLSGSKGKYSQGQDQTVHLNLEGMGCTFAQGGWREQVADYIDEHRGLITRCDLALDFFDGLRGGFERLREDFTAGRMDHMGNRPVVKAYDDWNEKNRGRSLYIGTRESGKCTNVYEKGIQLFGPEDASNWWRAELRWGNQKRVLSSDMLRRPADFFACASQWHADLLAEHGAEYKPAKVPLVEKLKVETVQAEVTRAARWFLDTASPIALLAFEHLNSKEMHELFDEGRKLPQRLRKFDRDEIAECCRNVCFSVTGKQGRAGAPLH